MASPTTLDTYQGLVGAFTDFLIAAIHTILYERGIYPRESFLSARKYNFPVRQNRHPKVCKWIVDAVSAVEAELLKVVYRSLLLAKIIRSLYLLLLR
jgi:mitotic spindle assembly checkpoint protein MAD2B